MSLNNSWAFLGGRAHAVMPSGWWWEKRQMGPRMEPQRGPGPRAPGWAPLQGRPRPSPASSMKNSFTTEGGRGSTSLLTDCSCDLCFHHGHLVEETPQ